MHTLSGGVSSLLLVIEYLTFLLAAMPGFSIAYSEILESSEAWVDFPLEKLLDVPAVSLRQRIL